MASGDPQRVWFPEMLEHLRAHWREGLALDALIAMRDDLDAMLQHLRASREFAPRSSGAGPAGPWVPARRPT